MSDPRLDSVVDALRIALSQSSRRAGVVASNLTNVDTPGYRALDVHFDDYFDAATAVEPLRTDTGHLRGTATTQRGTLMEAPVTRMRHDGNTVDVDLEMTKLAMVHGKYRTSAEMLRKRFALLIYAATDGRGGV